jgi:hypothetical protein
MARVVINLGEQRGDRRGARGTGACANSGELLRDDVVPPGRDIGELDARWRSVVTCATIAFAPLSDAAPPVESSRSMAAIH